MSRERCRRAGIRIETPTATIAVRGTELAITVAPYGSTTVGVVSGEAEVASHKGGESEIVGVGHSVSVSETGEIGAPTGGITVTRDPIVDSAIPEEIAEANEDYWEARTEATETSEEAVAEAYTDNEAEIEEARCGISAGHG